MARDPVCGMDVDPKAAAGKSEYKGETCYFCGPGCKRAFDERPQKFRGSGLMAANVHQLASRHCRRWPLAVMLALGALVLLAAACRGGGSAPAAQSTPGDSG